MEIQRVEITREQYRVVTGHEPEAGTIGLTIYGSSQEGPCVPLIEYVFVDDPSWKLEVDWLEEMFRL